MKVLIVEKPSMKRKMIEALKNEKDVVVTNSIGHIESLADLESYLNDNFNNKQKIFWNDILKFLPFIPEKFHHKITNQKVFNEIARHLTKADEIILGCDPDREGELIQRNILKIAHKKGIVKTDKVTRIWLHSETKPEIQKAYKNRKSY